MRVDYHLLRQVSPYRRSRSARLIVVLVPGIGFEANGSTRCIAGPSPAEPSEFAKLALICFNVSAWRPPPS